MRTTSIKALIDQPDQLRMHLRDRLNAYPLHEATIETDYSYTLFGNDGLVKVKLRQNDAALSPDQNSLIVERNTLNTPLRENDLALISPVAPIPFKDLSAVLGMPDHVISKQREIFASAENPALRIYLDNFNGQNLLELQLQDPNQDAQLLLAEYIKILDIQESQLTSLSYVDLNLQQKFKGNQFLLHAMGAMPARLADKIATLPSYKAKKEARIIQKGAIEQHGFLITAGKAFANDGTVLEPGKLLGEFSALEGKRTMDVVCSNDFQATILPQKIVQDILRVPGYMTKYLDWKLGGSTQSSAAQLRNI